MLIYLGHSRNSTDNSRGGTQMKISILIVMVVLLGSIMATSGQATFNLGCTETDGGMKPFVAGKTKGIPDTCGSHGENIYEFYCKSNHISVKKVDCASYGA